MENITEFPTPQDNWSTERWRQVTESWPKTLKAIAVLSAGAPEEERRKLAQELRDAHQPNFTEVDEMTLKILSLKDEVLERIISSLDI